MVSVFESTALQLIGKKQSWRCLSISTNPCLQTSNPTVIATCNAQQKLKSYHDIPSSQGLLPSIIQFILDGGAGLLHEHCDRLHKKLGPIFRHKCGSRELIFLSDTRLIRHVIANEGPYPIQVIPESWSYFNKLNNVERGMFFLDGEPWARLRKNFNKVLLGNHMSQYSAGILDINDDLVDFWERESDGHSIVIRDVHAELNKWSIESMGLMLFDRRMGCIRVDASPNHGDDRPERLVENVATMFTETTKLQSIPVQLAHKFNLPPWRRYSEASFNMLELASELVSEHLEKSKSSSTNKGLVKDMLEISTLTEKDIVKSLVDLIIAAADTTSNALQWMFYLIAKHQEIQNKLYEEAEELLTKFGSNPDEIYGHANYLRAFLKESLRLYPTAPFIARAIDKHLILDSYSIPPGNIYVFSCFTTSRSEKYFTEPNECKPERWLRAGKESRNLSVSHAYASLPFGLGARACIGRRAAELEMALLITSLVTKFRFNLLSDRDAKIKLRMILTPAKPIQVQLQRRSH